MTTAPLSARSPLGPRGLNGGSIAGAVVGSVVGALLILLCIVPVALRTRRQWRNRHGRGDDALQDAEQGQSPSPGGRSSPPHFDESKRLSTDPVPGSTPGSESGHTNGQHPKSAAAVPNGINSPFPSAASDLNRNQPTLTPPAGVTTIHQGIPSPTSPPLSPTTRQDSLTKTPQDGQAYPTPPPDDVPPPKPRHASVGTRENTRDLTLVDSSYGPPSRQLTGFTSKDITEEPESFESSTQSPTHRTFSRVSGSIREFIRNQQRRGSRRSTHNTDGPRSPSASICTTEQFPQPDPVQPFFQETDIPPSGLAWSYYNDPDLISDAEAAYKPPEAPTSQPPSGFVPGSLSPVSLPDHQFPAAVERTAPSLITQHVVSEPESISPDTVTPFRPFDRQSSLNIGPGNLSRTDTLPLQPIVADIPHDTFASPPSGPSGRPMDFMGPSNDVEKSWRVDQEFLKNETPSPPMEAPLPYNYIPEAEPRYVQPVQPMGMSPDESDYQSPPELALNDQQYMLDFTVVGSDMDQSQVSYFYSTPPPSIPSIQNTPETRLSDYTASLSPRSDIGQGSTGQPDASPRFFPCDQCHRVFDQIHKLNHHKRYHDRPHECTHPGCTMRFGTKTHLDRHINDKHKKTRQFHCTEHGCPYSRQGGKSFPRKDNWRRHMMNKHQITPQTEPVEYGDSTMAGT